MQENKIGLPIVYALLGALIGGIIWGLIAVLFDYELGLVAWAIGGLTGYAVVLAAKDSVTQLHQIVAVISSLIGIVLGKYFSFGYWFNEGFQGIFDSITFTYFRMYFVDLFGGMDIVFVLLAIVTAWQIPGKHINLVEANGDEQQAE